MAETAEATREASQENGTPESQESSEAPSQTTEQQGQISDLIEGYKSGEQEQPAEPAEQENGTQEEPEPEQESQEEPRQEEEPEETEERDEPVQEKVASRILIFWEGIRIACDSPLYSRMQLQLFRSTFDKYLRFNK